jgi:hypothetical protein
MAAKAGQLGASCCAITILVSLASGCQSFVERMQKPTGPVQQQRYQATLHDPFPSPHGMPVVEGTRPRDYLNPLPQPVQDRYLRDSFWAGQNTAGSPEDATEPLGGGLLNPPANPVTP